MAKFQQMVIKDGKVVAVVTSSDHGAVAAAARKTGLPMVGMHAVRAETYLANLKSDDGTEEEDGWEVDDSDPDCARKDAAIMGRRR